MALCRNCMWEFKFEFGKKYRNFQVRCQNHTCTVGLVPDGACDIIVIDVSTDNYSASVARTITLVRACFLMSIPGSRSSGALCINNNVSVLGISKQRAVAIIPNDAHSRPILFLQVLPYLMLSPDHKHLPKCY